MKNNNNFDLKRVRKSHPQTIVLNINPIAERLVSTIAFFLFGLTGGI